MPSSPNRRKKPNGDNGPTAFGRLLKASREKAGMSQADLARAARVSAGHIGTIETGDRGHQPGRDTVIALANAVGADLAQMLAAAGLPGPGPGEKLPNVVLAAIRQDPYMTSDSKAALSHIYREITRKGGCKTI
jgi:transcriptional regulator with XRE-family HTH domain